VEEGGAEEREAGEEEMEGGKEEEEEDEEEDEEEEEEEEERESVDGRLDGGGRRKRITAYFSTFSFSSSPLSLLSFLLLSSQFCWNSRPVCSTKRI